MTERMSFIEYTGRTLAHLVRVNRDLLVFSLVLFGVFFAAAAKAETPYYSPPGYDGKYSAIAMCNAYKAATGNAGLAPYANCPATGPYGIYAFTATWRHTNGNYFGFYSHCEFEGQIWNGVNGSTAAGSACTTPEEADPEHCEDLAAATSGEGNENIQSIENPASCIGGCAYGAQGAHTETIFGGSTIVTGDFGFSGGTCSVTPESPAPAAIPPAAPPGPVCKPAGSGQSFCIRDDGKKCYTLTGTSEMICWSDGETGTKTDGSMAQQRAAGTATPAAPPPPPGDTMSATGTPTTSTTAAVNGSTTTNIITTVQNYTTVNGTNAGTVNSGVPAGSNTGGPSSGDSGTDGTASGEGQCDAPVTCTGDAVQCALLVEAHKTACQWEGEAEGEPGGLEEGEVSPASGTGTEDGVWAEEQGIGEDGLDDSGFLAGARSCPIVTAPVFYGVAIPMPNETLCLWLSIGAYLILAFAGLASLRIMMGAV